MPYFCIRFRERRLSFLTCWLTRSDSPFPFFAFRISRLPRFSSWKEKKSKKTSWKIWKLYWKVLTFAPAFRNEAASVEMVFLRVRSGCFPFPFCSPFRKRDDGKEGLRKKIKKTSEKIWKLCLKVLTFASAFGNEAGRQDRSAIFEDIYINNTSSTRARLQHQDEVTLGIRKNRQYL